jgi:methyltransferase (TIGR00027 family)
MQAINPSIRRAIALRARFMDDYARQCLLDGFDQVVLLGAGYDSRFMRLPEMRGAQVFELDLYSTQVIKKTLTRRLLGRLPENVTYVALDFSRDSVVEKLLQAGFRRDRKTLTVWEGVTLFLNEAIVAETLGRLTELGPGNRVVFDFIPPELVDDETDYQGNRQLLDLCASIKEPLTFGCRPDRMKTILHSIGYGNIGMTSMREANRIYGGSERIEDSYFFATAQVSRRTQANPDPRRPASTALSVEETGG